MFERYAVYYTPQGALAEVGAAWLGWDVANGTPVAHPHIAGLDVEHLTQTPRKYGLHGTIKPPFFLAQRTTAAQLESALQELSTQLAPVTLNGLEIRDLAGFIALTPRGDQTALAGMAAQVVTQLDLFRAEPSETELVRRRMTPLSPAQEQHLRAWGYPYVMDQFRFHITLTGRIKGGVTAHLPAIATHFAPHLPAPLVIDSLTLAGQDTRGMFHEIHRYALTG